MSVCPSCGSANAAGAKFCSECGTRLADAGPRVEERKVVTIVFCDLVGSTARAERLDPEDVRAELSSFHMRVRTELERRGGTVEKFIGDAVVAVFGAPAVHEDDAERAVRAALAIRDWAVDEGGVEVRLAVNTGEALVTVDARPDAGEGLVAGDVINTAARLQSAAPVGGILVGEATYRATEHAVEYRAHGPVDAKGKQLPVPAWEAVAARSRLGVDVELRPRTRLVGRTRELDQLLGALSRARAEREPQLVTIVGVPGMGKSRLVQELSAAVEREPELIRWRQGRSLPYGQGVSYWALGEMVKAEAGILESDPADVAETKLDEVVARVCTGEEALWIRSLLRPLIGAAEDGGGSDRRAEAFSGWRRFLEGLADERPTVLVFEDLHWADDGLLDFVDGLVDWATDLPLLVVATARPELLTRRAHWGGGKPNATTLSLAPLSEAETAEVVHAVLERAVLPADVQTAVLARAGGNPLYAEEFARLIAERAPDAGGELPVPDSLQGLIAARLDALSRAEKELIQDAAVVGKVFWRGALVASRSHEDVDDVLRALERKEFVRRERQSSVEGDDQYAFRHVLVRDVAYAQIPRAARAERHERAAEWIEGRVRPDDAAELLAHHYTSALEYARLVGTDAAELARRARTALRDAGRRAAALSAFVNATHFYEEALSLTTEDDPEWPRLALEHAEASTYVDLSGDRHLVRARAALLADDADHAARTEMALGEYRWLRGDRDSAVVHFGDAERFTESMSDQEARLRVLANLARFAMLADEYERSIRLARPALELAQALGRDDMRAHALNTIGTSRASMGDAGGVDDLEASCEIARRGGGPEFVRSTGNLASILVGAGKVIRAAELHREALAIAKEIGYEEPTRWLSTEIAIDCEGGGAWDEARAMVDELIPGYAESPFWIEPQTRVCRGRMAIAEGNIARAVADADHAVDLVREGRSFQSLCDPFAFRARLHVELHELDAARRLVRELLEIWLETRSGYLDPWVLDAWYTARHTGEERRFEAAINSMPPNAWLRVVSSLTERDFARAVGQLDEMGAASSAALARLWASEWLVENGRAADAAPFLEQSLAFWRSVGASAYAQRGELLAAAS